MFAYSSRTVGVIFCNDFILKKWNKFVIFHVLHKFGGNINNPTFAPLELILFVYVDP